MILVTLQLVRIAGAVCFLLFLIDVLGREPSMLDFGLGHLPLSLEEHVIV